MASLVVSLYVAFLLIVVVIVAFVVYHLKKYNVDAVSARLQVVVFVAITVVLVGINIVVFFSLPLESLLGNGGNFGTFGE
jgi:hypothetical protein